MTYILLAAAPSQLNFLTTLIGVSCNKTITLKMHNRRRKKSFDSQFTQYPISPYNEPIVCILCRGIGNRVPIDCLCLLVCLFLLLSFSRPNTGGII